MVFLFNQATNLEQAYAKEPLLTVDDESLGISDWIAINNSTNMEGRSLFTATAMGEISEQIFLVVW